MARSSRAVGAASQWEGRMAMHCPIYTSYHLYLSYWTRPNSLSTLSRYTPYHLYLSYWTRPNSMSTLSLYTPYKLYLSYWTRPNSLSTLSRYTPYNLYLSYWTRPNSLSTLPVTRLTIVITVTGLDQIH
jgi:hypothetical protein